MSVKTKQVLTYRFGFFFLVLNVTLSHNQFKEIKTTSKQTVKRTLIYCQTKTLLFECSQTQKSFNIFTIMRAEGDP